VETQKYRIVTTGEIHSGFTRNEVVKNLLALCKDDSNKIERILSGTLFVFLTDIDLVTARRHKTPLDQTGLVCQIVPLVPPILNQKPHRQHEHGVPETSAISCCPKCGTSYGCEESCTACGIIPAKYLARQKLGQSSEAEFRDQVKCGSTESKNSRDDTTLKQKSRHRLLTFGVVVTLLFIIAMNTKIEVAQKEPIQASPQPAEEARGNRYNNPRISEGFDYYDIDPTTKSELYRQLNENHYVNVNGKQYSAALKHSIAWSPRLLKNVNGTCSVDSIDVLLEATFRMPRWSNQSLASPELQELWNKSYETLLTHEKGHRDLAVEEANEMQRMMSQVESHATCQELHDTINRIGFDIKNKYYHLQLNYDECTKHGVEQNNVCR